MLIKPRLADHKVVGFYIGSILTGLGGAMILPLLTALIFREWSALLDYLLSGLLTSGLGLALRLLCFTKKEIDWLHGLTIAALFWLAAAAAAALPFFLGGNYASYLDAFFEAMNALATAGFSLARDLDHISAADNMWRHLLMFFGGQGIVVMALSFLTLRGAAGFKLYAGEAREERIVPNIISTARLILQISLVFLVAGTAALTLILRWDGLSWTQSFWHGLWLFMSGFSTGGFAPHSQNILYYHSWRLEIALLFLMFLGVLNFRLHYAVYTGDRRELYRNIETVVLFCSFLLAFFLVCAGLLYFRVYPGLGAALRQGVFLLGSSHSTAGFMTVYAGQFFREWPQLSLLALLAAMAVGGSACSTAGGIKALRIGILFKALRQDIKRLLLPPGAVSAERYHHVKDYFLDDKVVRGAAIVTLLYLTVFGLGALAGVCYGYPFLPALFESISAATNAGLSCGIITPGLPVGLKLIYLLEIWGGRLEFTAVLGLLAYGWACLKGK
ncbi:potassium transport systems membrane protein [Candidatus Termititenax aidoneus]|uniref:Potassium transport systems membrane protein n=1 Tax=Termititenax aidoneus TaxID=2218524 RepID=A0A388T912_TERA1|nr:potassium transport systems membrane protein [Candidatus Termititenax aidoneus]